MNNFLIIGKYLDQPILVKKISRAVPTVLLGSAGFITLKHLRQTEKSERKDEFIRNIAVLTGTVISALLATRGLKPIKIGNLKIKGFEGLSEQVSMPELIDKNMQLVKDFIKNNNVNESMQIKLNKAINKKLNISEIKEIFQELYNKKKGKEFLNELIPNPENITSKEIFGEIKRLSLMGLIPVLGGILGGIIGDKLTTPKWKEKISNKIKEGTYQYLANIFLCNVGSGVALTIMERAKMTSKSIRAIGMIIGIITFGVLGGSTLANLIGEKFIQPVINKFQNKKNSNSQKPNKKSIYSERKPEAIDIGLHIDDIATVAVLSGLKWIEPILPLFYSISAYRAGIGYRNGKDVEK